MKQAFALLTVVLILGLLGILGSSMVVIAVGDLNIARSQKNGIRAHYRAEAGINQAIWMLINDPSWKTGFETDPDWTASLNETDYSVTAQNLLLAKAELVSIGRIGEAKREVRATVFKALGQAPPDLITALSGQDIFIWGTNLSVNPDSLFSNQDIDIQSSSNLAVANKISAVQNINTSFDSTLTAGSIEAMNYPPAPASLVMPMLDLDSSDPNSYKNQALAQDQLYGQTEFASMLNANPNLILNGVTFVLGDIEIKRGQNLTVNGVLASDKNINIGLDSEGSRFADIAVNQVGNEPAGLLAKKNLTIGDWTNNIQINGLIYAFQDFTIAKFFPDFNFDLTGGLISSNLTIWTLGHNLNLVHNESFIERGLGNPGSSPVVVIEHWEEAY